MTTTSEQPHARSITATVLFADLVGFDRLTAASGSEVAYLAVTHLLGQLDSIARRHGGSVDKYLGDKLMALFGHPLPLAHPSRAAALAALEMRRRVQDYNREAELEVPLGLRVGINAGEVVSGEIRGPVVREFHVLGDAVNTAARINARTPVGEIWVEENVHAAIRDTLETRPLAALTLKGKARPVAVHALEAQRQSGIRHDLEPDETAATALIGRAAELELLEGHVLRLSEGQGSCVHIVGEAGSGKSRLLGALGASPHMEGVQVVRIDGGLHAPSAPLAVFAQLLEDGAGSARPARLDREAALGRIEAQLLGTAQSKPLLLVVEDVDRIDRDSAWVLARLRTRAAQAPCPSSRPADRKRRRDRRRRAPLERRAWSSS